MARLIMRRGPRPGQIFNLTDDVVTIGSGSKNDVVILDNDVSREHCRLIRVMADYELHDLESGRGTFVSGQRIKASWLLKPGSLIELGENITLEYDRADSTEIEPVIVRLPAHLEAPDATTHPFLVTTVGANIGHIYPLKGKEIRIGRDFSNDIVVQDPEVSRFHLVLRWMETGYEIEDQGSTNGTMVNSVPLKAAEPKMLHANDRIQMATLVEFQYTWQPGSPLAEPKPRLPATGRLGSTQLLREARDTSEMHILGTRRNRTPGSRLGTGLQPGSLVDHIFITYAREDWEAIVAPLTAVLQDAGLKVWVDQYLQQGAEDWMIAVEQALSECWLLVVVVSPTALESRPVRLAYRYFYNREKPLVPLLYQDGSGLPPELAKTQAVRFDASNRRASLEALAQAVRARQV